jgi:hypothetical protein
MLTTWQFIDEAGFAFNNTDMAGKANSTASPATLQSAACKDRVPVPMGAEWRSQERHGGADRSYQPLGGIAVCRGWIQTSKYITYICVFRALNTVIICNETHEHSRANFLVNRLITSETITYRCQTREKRDEQVQGAPRRVETSLDPDSSCVLLYSLVFVSLAWEPCVQQQNKQWENHMTGSG